MAIKAVAYRIVVKPDPVMETTKGGIVLALNKRLELNACTSGVVVDVGEDAWASFKPKSPNAGIQVGDKVYYGKYVGQWLKDPKTGEELLAINDEDITAKYVEDNDDEQKDSAPVVASPQ